jgi:hypothetical protein
MERNVRRAQGRNSRIFILRPLNLALTLSRIWKAAVVLLNSVEQLDWEGCGVGCELG